MAHASDPGAADPPRTDMTTAEPGHDALVAEVGRLRRLVGPSERSYVQRLEQLDRASAAVKEAEAANGLLRGELAQRERDLGRLRESQGRIHRLAIHRLRAFVGRMRTAVDRLARSSRENGGGHG